MAMPICLRLLVHWARRAASRADWTAGRSSAIRTAMIAITTSSSIKVKPRVGRWEPRFALMGKPFSGNDYRGDEKQSMTIGQSRLCPCQLCEVYPLNRISLTHLSSGSACVHNGSIALANRKRQFHPGMDVTEEQRYTS